MPCLFQCKLQMTSGCQCLGNLCALRLYSKLWLPCSLWPPEMPNGMQLPKIMYEEGDAHAELNRRKPDTVFGLHDKPLNLTLVSYAANGENITTRFITPGWLDPCEGNPGYYQSDISFGKPLTSKCRVTMHHLFKNVEAGVLHELYLNYKDPSSDLDYMLPVPVLIENMGHTYDENEDSSNWILVRRFFLTDSYPQRRYHTGLVRYASSLILLVKLRTDAPGKIYTPVLLAMLLTLSTLAIFWSAIVAWSYSRRSGLPVFNIYGFIRFFLVLCGKISDALLLSALLCGVMARMLYFTLQSSTAMSIVSRNDEEEYLIKAFLIVALALKIIEVIQILHHQLTIDIFLIDWEKPRAMNCLPRSISNTTGTNRETTDDITPPPPISVWRSYLVANEWNELQVFRKVHGLGHALLVAIIAEILGLSHNNLSQTDLLGFSVLLYLSLYFLQMLLRLGIYERYMNAGLVGFVDLCSLANISMLIVSLDQFGYYIHGRSPYGFADTDMRSMLLQLQREEQGLCGTRGLLKDSTQQTFTARLPSALRAYYRKMTFPLTEQGRYGRATGTRAMSDSERIEKCVQAYRNINRFLASFIDHALRDLDYEVRERGPVERLLDAESTVIAGTVDGPPKIGGVFYPDGGHAFDAVLWYGQEWTWATVELLMFLVTLIGCENVAVSSVTVAIIIQILALVTKSLAKRNLAEKTLIDKRFLI
ncbi:meckelin-like [Ctenocephalides felis]|uniref:meckelin-like n=1 Tax=Ctenocephalides felis TaxID=7515 RepID=UPI000E6E55DF|nr:meckelin-like [Ctenocephalides felis]